MDNDWCRVLKVFQHYEQNSLLWNQFLWVVSSTATVSMNQIILLSIIIMLIIIIIIIIIITIIILLLISRASSGLIFISEFWARCKIMRRYFGGVSFYNLLCNKTQQFSSLINPSVLAKTSALQTTCRSFPWGGAIQGLFCGLSRPTPPNGNRWYCK